MKEYGVDFFGEDQRYGREMMKWVYESYEKVWQEQLQDYPDSKLAISILKRKN